MLDKTLQAELLAISEEERREYKKILACNWVVFPIAGVVFGLVGAHQSTSPGEGIANFLFAVTVCLVMAFAIHLDLRGAAENTEGEDELARQL